MTLDWDDLGENSISLIKKLFRGKSLWRLWMNRCENIQFETNWVIFKTEYLNPILPKNTYIYIRVYRFSTKLELDFGASWARLADVEWYGDPT